MKTTLNTITLLLFLALGTNKADACSILYYVDSTTGKIYVANNEDYWYDVKPYIEIVPKTKNQYARLWYGWDNFAQGGVNEFGLFFDGASTPEEPEIKGYHKPKGNLGDNILSKCKTVNEAIDLLEQDKIALTNGHMFFGDKTGNAVVVEWVNGKRNLTYIKDIVLIATNFLLSDTTKGNYPCPRYGVIKDEIARIRTNQDTVDLKVIGNIIAPAVQLPAPDANNRIGGTLYSTFIELTDMELTLVYKLDNSRLFYFDLAREFMSTKKRKIKLEE